MNVLCVLRKVKERVDAKNAFDGYVHSMRSATEGSGDNKGLSATWRQVASIYDHRHKHIHIRFYTIIVVSI